MHVGIKPIGLHFQQQLWSGIIFAILGRSPRVFQIGKISAVNPSIGKFVILHNYVNLVSKKNKLAITHNIANKLKKVTM